ncbi:MAG: hypothetical protein N4A47_07585 [Clostridia bacterium]|jgi:hypothetical protein|nr:hypothetical protein [Clostridia bacterium]
MEKKLVSVNEVFTPFVVWMIVLGIFLRNVPNVFLTGIMENVKLDNEILLTVISVIVGVITVYVVGVFSCWISTRQALKGVRIDENNFKELTKKTTYFFMVMILLSGIVNFMTFNQKVESTYEKSKLRISYNMMLMDKDERVSYEQKAKKEIENIVMTMSMLSFLVSAAAYSALIPTEKKLIKKYMN